MGVFVIFLSGCVVELGVDGVKKSVSESFPTHQRTLDFIERIKSYDHLKLLGLGFDGFW